MEFAVAVGMHSDQLAAVLVRTSQRWPRLVIRVDELARHAEAVRATPENLRLHGEELSLAVACAAHSEVALRIFESEFISGAGRALQRLHQSRDLTADALQALRERLLLGDDPRIRRYSACGPLAAWVRRISVNVALNLLEQEQRERARAATSFAQRELPEERPGDEQSALAQAYLREAIARLTMGQRGLLQQHFQGLGLDQLSRRIGKHRATTARTLVTIRRAIADHVVSKFGLRFELCEEEARAALASLCFELDIRDALVSVNDERLKIPRFRGHPNWRENAPGVEHGIEEAEA